jgi:hypothetical protein
LAKSNPPALCSSTHGQKKREGKHEMINTELRHTVHVTNSENKMLKEILASCQEKLALHEEGLISRQEELTACQEERLPRRAYHLPRRAGFI